MLKQIIMSITFITGVLYISFHLVVVTIMSFSEPQIVDGGQVIYLVIEYIVALIVSYITFVLFSKYLLKNVYELFSIIIIIPIIISIVVSLISVTHITTSPNIVFLPVINFVFLIILHIIIEKNWPKRKKHKQKGSE